MSTLADRIAAAVAALRRAGHQVDAVSGATDVYRIDGGEVVTGPVLLALAIRLGLMDAPGGRQ